MEWTNWDIPTEVKEILNFLRPVTDDMALSLPSFQRTNKKLVVSDALKVKQNSIA